MCTGLCANLSLRRLYLHMEFRNLGVLHLRVSRGLKTSPEMYAAICFTKRDVLHSVLEVEGTQVPYVAVTSPWVSHLVWLLTRETHILVFCSNTGGCFVESLLQLWTVLCERPYNYRQPSTNCPIWPLPNKPEDLGSNASKNTEMSWLPEEHFNYGHTDRKEAPLATNSTSARVNSHSYAIC